MKNSPMIAPLVRNPHTGAMEPATFRAPAKGIMFPDGQNLWEHWQREVKVSTDVQFAFLTSVDASLNSFKWTCMLIAGTAFKMGTHVRLNVSSVPTIPGDNIDEYQFNVPLPEKLCDYKTDLDLTNASINVTEESKSTFIQKGTIHDFYVERESNGLIIHVLHRKCLYTEKTNLMGSQEFAFAEPVDLSTETYISCDFSIQIDGWVVSE